MEIFEAAAKEHINGVIFTYCYARPEDDKFVKRVIHVVEKHGGEVCFVQPYCDRAVLEKRVRSGSRKRFHKIRTVKMLNQTLERWDLFSPIPFVKSLCMDNTKTSAKKQLKKSSLITNYKKRRKYPLFLFPSVFVSSITLVYYSFERFIQINIEGVG